MQVGEAGLKKTKLVNYFLSATEKIQALKLLIPSNTQRAPKFRVQVKGHVFPPIFLRPFQFDLLLLGRPGWWNRVGR